MNDPINERETDAVLDAQPRYAVEHARWGNHFGARLHILWAVNLRPSLSAQFLDEAELEKLEPFLRELLHANQEDPGFCARMQQIEECAKGDVDRAWQLLDATPATLRKTGLFTSRFAAINQIEGFLDFALPLWAELRRQWPDDVAGFANGVSCLLALDQREDAMRLLDESPPCYRRYYRYWDQRAEIEGGRAKFQAGGTSRFQGQPDLGGLLIPKEELPPDMSDYEGTNSMKADTPRYDIIGDIHGQVGKLTTLLAKLGYREELGAFRHPDRQAIFLGDFIDRGSSSRETLHIVRGMVDGGAALAVVGNHEFNALTFHRQNCLAVEGARSAERVPQMCQKTLDEFVDHQQEWEGFLDWFRELPLFLELDGLRVVHAVWCPDAIATLGGRRTLAGDLLAEAMKPGTAAHRAVRILLNGWLVPLPGESFVEAFEGSVHRFIRLAWWKSEGPQTYRRLSLPFSIDLPEDPIPHQVSAQFPGYAPTAPPLFLGHYCLPPDEVEWPLAPNIVCVDYNAARRGPLVAYRWDGEATLSPAKFVK